MGRTGVKRWNLNSTDCGEKLRCKARSPPSKPTVGFRKKTVGANGLELSQHPSRAQQSSLGRTTRTLTSAVVLRAPVRNPAGDPTDARDVPHSVFPNWWRRRRSGGDCESNTRPSSTACEPLGFTGGRSETMTDKSITAIRVKENRAEK